MPGSRAREPNVRCYLGASKVMSYPSVALRDSQGKSGFRWAEKWFLRQIFKAIGPAPIRFAIKDGEELSPPGIAPIATVVIHDRRTIAALILDPEVAFGEGFAEGRIEVIGDLPRAIEAVFHSWPSGAAAKSLYSRLSSRAMSWLQANTLDGSRNNIHSHYDLGNDFYKLWLDSQLVYTCAYFESPAATLEQAQESKMEYVCRKLGLQPGERVIEAGCGWGSLALYMARKYGVRVRAFNISREQILYARQRALASGLSNQVEFIEDDYRNISRHRGGGQSDVFVSVGMLEHVGAANYGELGEVIYRSVGASGRGLLHFIGKNFKEDFSRWIRKRIFQGAYAPTLQEAMTILEPHHYSVLDVENLRLHYAKTVEHWLERFDRSSQQVSDMYSPCFQRAWRLYLAGSIAGFRAGSVQLFQIVFAGPDCRPIHWTRAPLYAGAHSEAHAPWTPAMS